MPIASRARIGPHGPPGAVPGRQRPAIGAACSAAFTYSDWNRRSQGRRSRERGTVRQPATARGSGKQRQAPSTSSDRVADRGMNDRRAPGDVPRLIEVYAEHADIELSPYRSWTLKAGRTAGGEPDECYIVGADQSKDRPDPRRRCPRRRSRQLHRRTRAPRDRRTAARGSTPQRRHIGGATCLATSGRERTMACLRGGYVIAVSVRSPDRKLAETVISASCEISCDRNALRGSVLHDASLRPDPGRAAADDSVCAHARADPVRLPRRG